MTQSRLGRTPKRSSWTGSSPAEPAPRSVLSGILTGAQIAIGVIGSGLLFWILAGDPRPPTPQARPKSEPDLAAASDTTAPPRRAPNSIAIPAERSTPPQPAAAARPAEFDPLAPPAAIATEFLPPRQFAGPISYPNAATIGFPEATIHLAGIVALGRNDVCYDEVRAKWACGLAARAAIGNMIKSQTITCYRDLGGNSDEYQCSLGKIDLSLFLLKSGFALSRHPSIELHEQLIAEASAARRGAWSGNWSVSTLQPYEDVQ